MFCLSGNICLVWLVAHSGSLVLTEITRRRSKVFRLHVTENKWSKGKDLPSVKTRLLFSNFHFCCSDCFPLKSFRSCLNPNKCIFIGVRWLLIVALHWFYHNVCPGGGCSWGAVRGGHRGRWASRPQAGFLPAAQKRCQTYCDRCENLFTSFAP